MEEDDNAGHGFGGGWTVKKLEVLAGYLKAYTTALKNQPFRKVYIDAFAGSGYRNERRQGSGEASLQSLSFPDLAETEPQELLKGSAHKALETAPPFDKYIFIEKNSRRCDELEKLKREFPHLAHNIDILPEDANAAIQKLCEGDWRSQRAVLFVDPYGMQVDWETIVAVAKTEAIDLWLLFPLGMGVNRLLTKSGDIPEEWRGCLNRFLGTENWYDALYERQHTTDLFGEQEHIVKARTEAIGRYFNERLGSVFAGVAQNPGALRNSTNNPLYLLCFAVGNERGKRVALRIAEHLLGREFTGAP